ncbi:MAG: thioredoxin [Anaerolineae bacterium]
MTNLLKRLMGDQTEEKSAAPAAAGNGQPRPEPVEVTDETFAEMILQCGKPAVLDLWAEWCTPCHMIAPSIADMAVEYDGRAVVAKLNVDENQRTAGQLGIMGIPTVLYFKDGKEADRQVGVTSYARLASKLEDLLD